MAPPALLALAVLAAAALVASAHAGYSEMLANTTTIPLHLLEDPFSGSAGRSLLADPALKWDDWKRIGRYAQIANPQMPDRHSSTGQVAIHAALIPGTYKIILWGRNLPKSGPKSVYEPGIGPNGQGGNVSTVYDVKTGTYKVAVNYDTLFCAGHTWASDGTLVATGGDMGYIGGKNSFPFMKEGRDAVRLFDRKTMQWTTLPVKLTEYRWYPTQVVLPDDRVIIVGGFLDDPSRPTGKPAPSIDVFDYKTKQIVVRKTRYDLGKKFFTNITPGYQQYPVVQLLPWTDPNAPDDYFLLFYSCRTGQVVRFTSRNEFLPMWNTPGMEPQGVCAAFSAMGAGLPLPLRPENNYKFELAMFGGGTQGAGLDCKGICNEPANKHIVRLKLPSFEDAVAGKWPKYWEFNGQRQSEEMPWPRVFTDAVLLPNGKILICNGAQRGVPGGTIDGGSSAKESAFTALLYDPDKPAGGRITPLATSKISRHYHSVALLLPSGDVWVAGSEQGDCVDTCKEGGSAPAGQEYRAELLQLPYAFVSRPNITKISASSVKYGGRITITYKHSAPITSASIIPPTAVTHSTNMMQRVIFLKTYDITPTSVTVELPAAQARVAPPGYYMLWINAGDVPCKEAAWIKLG